MDRDLVVTEGSDGAPAAAEIEAVYREASHGPPLCEPPGVAAAYARLYQALLPRGDLVTVSRRDAGQLIGLAFGHPWRWQEQTDPWGSQLRERLGEAADALEESFAVYLLAVHPGHLRQGVGGAVLDALVAAARAPAWLVTRDQRTPARSLYERSGWRPIGHGPDAPNGEPGLVFFRDWPSPGRRAPRADPVA